MEIKEINVSNQDPKHWLSKILKENGYGCNIPTNTIVNKRRPALGATHGEIQAKRNSVLIEPYITVIEVKKARFGSKVCAVIKDFKIDDIIAYLNDTSIEFKKIITTPESFTKVIRALKKHDPLYRQQYFLLIDECEKLIQHALFRSKIFGPMDEFFKFKNKAMVSATPIIPSHPAFEGKGFTILDILPTWDYSKPIKVVATNNIRTSLRNIIHLLSLKRDNKPVFLFTNCKRTILYFTRLEQVKDSFKVFCAENLDDDFFKKNKTHNVEYSVTKQSYAKYNAFTSRFFSAVDMYPVEPVHIIIVTNVPYVPHSIIDPATEAIQIFGRDRSIASSITHITNFYSKSVNEENIETKMELYYIQRLQLLADRAPGNEIKGFIKSQIDKELLAQAIKEDGTIEPFLKDHYDLTKSIKKLYHSKQLLLKAYKGSKFFLPELVTVQHQFSYNDDLKLARANGLVKNKEFITQLHKLLTEFETLYIDNEHEFAFKLDWFATEDPLLFNAYRELGYESIVALKYSKKALKEAIFNTKRSDQTNYFLMIDEVLASFKLNNKVYVDDIKSTLQAIYNKFNYEKSTGVIHTAKATDIEKYFVCKGPIFGKKVDKNGVYRTYYRLESPKDKISSNLKYLVEYTA